MSGALHGVVASLKAAAAAATDTFWKYVSLLLNTTNTNGAQNNTFLDSSTNNFTVTRNGDTTQGSFNPYMPSGYWSGYFDGTGDFLTVADNAALQMASGDFTIEFWINFASIANFQTIYDKGYTAAGGLLIQTGSGNGTLVVYAAGGTTITASAASYVGVWDHYALVRSGTTLTLYRNGTSVGSATNSTNFNSTASLFFAGSTGGGGYYVNGYLSNLRIVKGTAVYTAAFTPSTTPLTAISGTSLLCLQDNRFKDNSTNAFTITRNGDTRISKFAPFNPPASYSTASYGGSGYFDGTGDYLSVPRNNAFLPGANTDFTFEAWVYLTATPGALGSTIMAMGEWGASSDWFFYIDSSRQLILYQASSVTGFTNTSTLVPLNTWTHVAASRSGTGTNNLTVYVNGVGQSGTTNTTMVGAGGYNLTIGADQNGDESNFTGYISNARIVNGTAVYTANFTPPTAPLTAITNTSLLLNFTNAGIYDATTINDGQTVGNAQVSTTQAKFGTTSMYFDGTGDYLQFPNDASYRFGTGDFTVEFWINTTDTDFNICGLVTGSAGNWMSVVVASQLYWQTTYGVTNLFNVSATSILNGAWHHVAVTRTGTSTRLFFDGVAQGTSPYTDSTNYNGTGALRIGSGINGDLNGYIQDLRLTNGVARYTANFTPPTAAFPTL